jgi:hypothetical protein
MTNYKLQITNEFMVLNYEFCVQRGDPKLFSTRPNDS